ncbi:hypothetical protein KGF56_000713 [Candida oxycetoniae]|uniref:TauD/TfdA-like domain-containing protein n=1 Tax=Candida oxycetoniae TaxID=497107 RepID=A0AAI9WZM8_9ASCO|nr:uncharacterized protein KGF56_000713 [Candida oxycetoniae]KAI3406581.2 hypothetical protein KGF56_000713 [Candida oxycetoniae]
MFHYACCWAQKTQSCWAQKTKVAGLKRLKLQGSRSTSGKMLIKQRPLWVTLQQVRYNSSKQLSLVKFNNKEISLRINGKPLIFNNVFLRDSCTSPESVDSATSQKLFTTAECSKNLTIEGEPIVSSFEKEPALQVQWSNNNGKTTIRSTYSWSFLNKNATQQARRSGKFFDKDRKLWDKTELTNNLSKLHHNYKDLMNDERTFFNVLHNLNRYGLCFIDDIPRPEMTEMNEANVSAWPVSKIANKFGYIKKTFYGSLFNVRNLKSEAKNIAYTNTFLPLHMDLLYYESPPGLQMLHAIDNSTLGGENLFCDSFLAAEYVRNKDPIAYKALTQIPITYHYDNNNEYYYYKRPLIVEDPEIDGSCFPKIHAINYSPPFQGPFEVGVTKDEKLYELFDDFVRGFQLFENFINDSKNHYEVKLKEGSCVIFENRRTLHSRNGFSDSNGGDRWLMGTYVDGDSFRSKLRVAYRRFA